MEKILIWEQGGLKNVLFSKNIVSIQQSKDNKDYCEISVDYIEEPIKISISVNEVLNRLNLLT